LQDGRDILRELEGMTKGMPEHIIKNAMACCAAVECADEGKAQACLSNKGSGLCDFAYGNHGGYLHLLPSGKVLI